MGIADIGRLSIGEWYAICRRWDKAHGGSMATPPSEDEFDAAIIAARGY